MEDRERISRLVDRKVAVRLNSAEARGVEILATLKEKRDDGITLSDIGELGPGPTMFCPWDAVRDVSLPLPEEPPFDRGGEVTELVQNYGDLGEPPEAPERFREPSARTLERVVPVAQKQAIEGITVAIASLELYGGGLGVLRWRISFEEPPLWYGRDLGIPEPWFEIRDVEGRTLSWAPQGAGASDTEMDGDVRVEGLPDAGELEVEVTRLVVREWSEESEEEEEVESYDGPWTFRFSV